MIEMHFRPIERSDDPFVQKLLRASGVSFDLGFVERLLSRSLLPGNCFVGGFVDGGLAGVYGLYFYPLWCRSRWLKGVTWCFLVVDTSLQGAGIGSRLLGHAAATLRRSEPDLVVGFVDARLCAAGQGRRPWSEALDRRCGEVGYSARRRLHPLTPVFRPARSGRPTSGVPPHERLKATLMDARTAAESGFAEAARASATRLGVAEDASPRILAQLKTDPAHCYLLAIRGENRSIGFVSCYTYEYHKGSVTQAQLHFDVILAEAADRAIAVNACVEELERQALPIDVFVINNSSLLAAADLKQSGFHRGFAKIETSLWYRPDDQSLHDVVGGLTDTEPFSLTVI